MDIFEWFCFVPVNTGHYGILCLIATPPPPPPPAKEDIGIDYVKSNTKSLSNSVAILNFIGRERDTCNLYLCFAKHGLRICGGIFVGRQGPVLSRVQYEQLHGFSPPESSRSARQATNVGRKKNREAPTNRPTFSKQKRD